MTNITIQREGKEFGPYPVAAVQQYLDQGILFPHDLARDAATPAAPWVPLTQVLTKAGVKNPAAGGNFLARTWKDLKALELGVIFPWREIKSLQCFKDRKLLYLGGVGLVPMFALAILPGKWAGYWVIALYFSGLWSLFFYYLFKTPQIVNKLCVLSFFFTAIIPMSLLVVLQQIPPWTILYGMANGKDVLTRFIGMFLGVGIHEELCKAAILFWLARRPGKILMPQSLVFYGMMSGLGFGIYEGVHYQQTLNRQQELDTFYFLNVLRLTSLPFLHAIWTGIAGYFIAFAALYPRRQYGLWAVAIGIPALLHAVYNTFGWNLIGLASAMLGVVLLMTYLSNCVRIQQSLLKP